MIWPGIRSPADSFPARQKVGDPPVKGADRLTMVRDEHIHGCPGHTERTGYIDGNVHTVDVANCCLRRIRRIVDGPELDRFCQSERFPRYCIRRGCPVENTRAASMS